MIPTTEKKRSMLTTMLQNLLSWLEYHIGLTVGSFHLFSFTRISSGKLLSFLSLKLNEKEVGLLETNVKKMFSWTPIEIVELLS